jgi:hypothetical protein
MKGLVLMLYKKNTDGEGLICKDMTTNKKQNEQYTFNHLRLKFTKNEVLLDQV